MVKRWIEWLFPLLLLTVPFSAPIALGTHELNVPSEPLIFLLAVLLFINIDLRTLLTREFIRHPIALAGMAYLIGMIFTSLFSSDILASVKYSAVAIAHWWTFFIGFWVFTSNQNRNISHWINYYSLTSLAIILYALVRYYQFEFRPDASVLIAQPFFSDHTLLSAVMAMVVFYWIAHIHEQRGRVWTFNLKRVFPLVVVALTVLGLYFLSSRAAWLSLVASVLLGLCILFIRWQWKSVVLLAFGLGLLAAAVIPRIAQKDYFIAEARKGSASDQLRSTFNFTSDVSNLERLNRYSCAWRMFLDRPITGFGPGTFAEAYLPYQRPEEMTRISVTSTHRPDGQPHQEGRGGSAHSEYLQALAEMGFVGFAFWMALMGTIVITSLRLIHENRNADFWRMTAIILGLATYGIHALFNNFLHQEELAIMFWAMLAYLVKIDLERNIQPQTHTKKVYKIFEKEDL